MTSSADVGHCPSHTTIRTSLPSHVTFQALIEGRVRSKSLSASGPGRCFSLQNDGEDLGRLNRWANMLFCLLSMIKKNRFKIKSTQPDPKSTSFQVRICCNNCIKWYLQNDEQLTAQTWGRNHVYLKVHHQGIRIVASNRETPNYLVPCTKSSQKVQLKFCAPIGRHKST